MAARFHGDHRDLLDPMLLGTANVDGNGRFSKQVRLPTDFPPARTR